MIAARPIDAREQEALALDAEDRVGSARERFVLAKELLAQENVLVRKLLLPDRRRGFVKTGLPEMFTGRGAVDRILPPGAATLLIAPLKR